MSDTAWLDAEQQVDWVRFAAVLELLPAALDAQLSRDEGLTHFDYFALAMLSESPERTLRMTALAARTNATLPRLSRVVTPTGSSRPGRAQSVPAGSARHQRHPDLGRLGQGGARRTRPCRRRSGEYVIDALTPAQLRQLGGISSRLLEKLDPDGRMFARLSRGGSNRADQSPP